ncbi:hypothetical protein PRIPAC_78913, partial [Pristionchus pacificus]
SITLWHTHKALKTSAFLYRPLCVRVSACMAQPANQRFRFNLYDIALREELRLTEKQRLKALNYFESKWRQDAYIDVLPTTIFVPREVAESKLGIKRSVIIAGIDPEYIHVYDAPRFRSRKFVKKPEYDDSYFKPFVNVTKDDLKVVTVRVYLTNVGYCFRLVA